MPSFNGNWTASQQLQAKGANTWPTFPGAPTIGTATAGVNNCGSVTFTAPSNAGYPAAVTGYRVISAPGCISNTGSSSPIVVTGLTNGTSYTFKVQATNLSGYGALSGASNSITASIPSCQTYTTAGCFTWVAPTGVTSVSVLVVGGGGGGGGNGGGGGGGGALRYRNSYSVTPGNSYSVKVGAAGTSIGTTNPGVSGGQSYFVSSGTVVACGGTRGTANRGCGGAGGTGSGGCGGGSGGKGGNPYDTGCNLNGGGGGGAAGYSGNGGNGHSGGTQPTACGGGGGGGGFGICYTSPCSGGYGRIGGYGGGVGLYGKGATGATTNTASASAGSPGTPGSGGSAYFYGGGGSGGGNTCYGAGYQPASGAVRIVWASSSYPTRGTPAFPTTNVGA